MCLRENDSRRYTDDRYYYYRFFKNNYRNDFKITIGSNIFVFFMIQGDRPIVSGLQHDHAVRMRVEPEQHLPVRAGRSDHITGRVPEHMSDQNVGSVHRVHAGLRCHVQQSVARASVAHESEEKRHQGNRV